MRSTKPLATLALALALAAGGCMQNRGPSNVAEGKQFVTGSPDYDEFFTAVYQLQVSLGAAPNREREIRQHLSEALQIDAASRAEEITEAVGTRVVIMTKQGAGVKLELSGMEADGSPASVLTTTGTAPEGSDKAVVSAVDQAAKDAATLLGDTRRAAKMLQRLGAQTPALEQGIDEKFRAAPPGKKSDVTKNLSDAKALIPLMTSRAADIEERTEELLRKLEKSVNGPPSGEEPAKAAEGEAAKKGKEKPKGAHPESKGGAHPETKAGAHPEPKPGGHPEPRSPGHAGPKPAAPKANAGSEEPAAPKPAPKPAAPPSDDFEP